MWLTGLAAPRHVGSSRTGARTRVPCIGRRISNHCATREALSLTFCSCSGEWLRPGVGFLFTQCRFFPRASPRSLPPPRPPALHPLLSASLKAAPPGFPGGTVVKNPPASAGDMGCNPGRGRSHMLRSNYVRAPQLLSLCSRAHKPQLLSRAPRARALQQEKPLP